jgi:hypothetical protein
VFDPLDHVIDGLGRPVAHLRLVPGDDLVQPALQCPAEGGRSELTKQLDRMILTRGRILTIADRRLTASPCWFKFGLAEDFVSGDQWVLRGMYVPADHLRFALSADEPRDGPRGGFAVTYQNMKYVTRDTVVELVRRGLVGTTRVGTRRTLDVIADIAATTRSSSPSRHRPLGGDPRNGAGIGGLVQIGEG